MQHLALEQLHTLLAQAENEVPVGSVYRHYRDNKGARPYTVTGHAITEADQTVVVLYRSSDQIVFSRPLKEFTETVRGGTQKRFQKIIL